MRQKYQEFKASLAYKVRPYLKKRKKRKKEGRKERNWRLGLWQVALVGYGGNF
jgi:hypothetical protein